MKELRHKELSQRERAVFKLIKKLAAKSVSDKRHKVGAAVETVSGKIYRGITIGRTKAIGSTCAERMALDSWYWGKRLDFPKKVYLIANFNRVDWTDKLFCLPCGVCLEMFYEFSKAHGIKNLEFLCSNWKTTEILKIELSELFPKFKNANHSF